MVDMATVAMLTKEKLPFIDGQPNSNDERPSRRSRISKSWIINCYPLTLY